ncbi:hypothetical protein K458DRAFT_412973 [Lentithecium fluviatile CBS 122367]|uniref:Uncharacterized protein n=1 Tax=Lentithecium fluviatile CBS 122367 TaxID=1168545 RepID=A0A6G1JHY5_9PLEO|nr:hypothetical protein K458DRAFT_412973 [Lentithecium fluviatile CBS 122367]
MAPTSPTEIAQPIPLQSPISTPVDLRHPTPDLQSLQGAYISNIERLEEHAERMSEKGSDLGEEIRKLHEEQKLSDSRRSSLLSGHAAEEPTRQFSTRSRGCSTSSYTNSIVDVNGAARWGGYSPNGYITSPAGSMRSGSGSQSLPALQRQRSTSKASRLGQIVQAEEEEDALEPTSHPREQSPPQTERKVSSFTREYDQIAQDIHNELRNSVAFSEQYDAQQQPPYDTPAYNHLPDRPPTAASTDTTHKLRTLWQDFDGVHCPDTVPEEEPGASHSSGSRRSSLMKPPPIPPPQGAPPPGDDMVFYPAPVPKMLNLPKRLSQMPAANVQARRRTQLLESMQAEHRKSAAWLPEAESSNSNRNSTPMLSEPSGQSPKVKRKSRMSMANLPPQLRASAYFDQAPPTQEYEVKGESAEDTLNNILEASAHAPVSAFTDHPFAGHVGDEVYGRERKAHKKTKSQANELEKADNRKSRSSLNLLDTRRNSSGDPLNKLKKRNSSADLNMLTVRASESRMSLGQELDQHDPDARGPEPRDDDTPRRHSFDEEHHDNGDEEEEEEEPEEQYFGPPTTLLAELQMRKQQQKTRNLTAATAFPNGMHATLLELDAVAEIEKKKRRGQKVNLAWEAQQPTADDDDSDDDVPLGVLFPGRDGLINKRAGAAQHQSDWDRPLGLMAQRELEDNEPLSQRRQRLVGNRGTRDLSPNKRQTQLGGSQSQLHLAVPTSTTPQPESEEEGETLAQRLRRLKDRQALDDALGADVRKSTVSGDFAAELKSQFGVPDEEEKPKPTASPANGEPEEETLGQRRARLQAEALARGDANPRGTRPPLRSSMSMADILGANPINPNNSARKVSDEQLLAALPQGSLLRKSAEKQERQRASRMDMNNRMSSYENLNQPLLGTNIAKPSQDLPIAAKIQAYKDKLSGVSTPMTAPAANPSMMFNGGMMQGMTPSGSTMNFPGQRESYFPQPSMPMMGVNNMGMPAQGGYGSMSMMAPQMMNPQLMGMNMNMMGMPIAGMQGMAYPAVGGMSHMGGGMSGGMSGMGSVAGMRQSSMGNLPGSMQMGGMSGMGGVMMMEPPMDPRQRSAIDQWRQGVAP